jgi:hypothetical protein
MINLADLLNKGLLKPGDSLIWRRRDLRTGPKASINSDGKIVTQDGLTHRTPSGAARHLNNGKPIDGWNVWRLEVSNRSLTDLRSELG